MAQKGLSEEVTPSQEADGSNGLRSWVQQVTGAPLSSAWDLRPQRRTETAWPRRALRSTSPNSECHVSMEILPQGRHHTVTHHLLLRKEDMI